MKIILFIILFSATILSQNVWYVDRDATGSNNGRSWTDAWTTFDSTTGFPGMSTDGINWNIIGDGDTIYVSGGTDSTAYYTASDGGILYISPPGSVDLENELNPVYITFNTQVVVLPAKYSGRTDGEWANHIGDVYISERTANQSHIMWIRGVRNIKLKGFNFRHKFSNSTTYGLTVSGREVVIEDCHFLGNGNTPVGISIAGRDNTVRYCLIENPYSDSAGELDLVSHGSCMGGFSFHDNTVIYRNSNYGTDAHRDMFQASNFGYLAQANTYTAYIFMYNNLFIDLAEDGDAWNGGIYFSGAYTVYKAYLYNNIIVNRKTDATSMTPIWMGIPNQDEWVTYDLVWKSTLHLLNNTIIGKGSTGSRMFSTYNFDSLVVYNNICVADVNMSTFWGQGLYDPGENMYLEIDYNAYFRAGGVTSGSFSEGAGFGSYTYSQWTGFEHWSGNFFDANTITGTNTDITFDNKYDSIPDGYYTTSGRGLGFNLTERYGWLPGFTNDILGNERPESGAWDMGALQFTEDGVDTIPNVFTFTPVTGATRNTVYNSNTNTLAGIDEGESCTIWIVDGEYQINSDAWTSSSGTISLGDSFRVRRTSHATLYSEPVSCTLYISTRSAVFTITTEAEPPPVPITGGWLHQANGRKLFFNNRKAVITSD